MAASVPDALLQVPGAMIQQTARGQGSPYLRGFTGFRTVALVEGTIARLADAGYRVIAPDQIGFCRSTKPAQYQYTFHQLATNTRALLASRGVVKT